MSHQEFFDRRPVVKKLSAVYNMSVTASIQIFDLKSIELSLKLWRLLIIFYAKTVDHTDQLIKTNDAK